MTDGGRIRTTRSGGFAAVWMLVAALCVALVACSTDKAPVEPADRPGAPEKFSRVQPWPLPVAGEAAHPDLVATPQGDLLLSWVQPAPDDHRELRMARLSSPAPGAPGAWADPLSAGTGGNWFLNWADTPHVYALPDGSIWAHWLRQTGEGHTDYGIDLVHSGDGGRTWSPPTLVSLPDLPGDNGFVTFWPQASDELGMAWLDSREKATASTPTANDQHPGNAPADDGHGHGHGDGAMMLRAAIYGSPASNTPGAAASKLIEWPLDLSTCDCCTTASAMTSRGPVVVYRGRSADEIRDIRLVRLEGGAWTAPRDVHADGWWMTGCPVNGPVVVSEGNTVWVAWYTEADGQPELRLARSDDAGDSFGPPLAVANGPQVLGRLGLGLAQGHVLLSWLQEGDAGDGQQLMLSRIDRELGAAHSIPVAALAARGRASGIPRLAVLDEAAWLVWGEVVDGTPTLKGAVVR